MPEEEVPAQPVSGGDDNLMAALSYIWIISIVMLLTKKDSEFIQFHAKQGLVLFGISIVLWVISIPLFFLWMVNSLVYLVLFVAAVVGFIKAYGGEKYKIPVVGDIAEKINL